MIATYAMKIDVRSPFIDDSVLNEIRDFMGEEGDATIADLVSIYLTNTPKTIAKVGEDLKNDDMESLKAHIHALKGSSAGVGVIGISSLCKEIEECIHTGHSDGIYSRFEKILNVFHQVDTEFRELL
jgi:HPt (histidine-containing phosphotransfer) domain-containing protein